MSFPSNTQYVVDLESLASSPNLTNTAFQSPVDNNERSGLNAILGIGTQAAQILGAIAIQRQQSGVAADRQARIAQCGRRPLFQGVRRREYDRCVAGASAIATTPMPISNLSNDESKSIGGSGSPMKYIALGLGVLAIGTIAVLALRKK
jgi:hypothetical protein